MEVFVLYYESKETHLPHVELFAKQKDMFVRFDEVRESSSYNNISTGCEEVQE